MEAAEPRAAGAVSRRWLAGLGVCVLIALGSALEQSMGRWLQGGSLRFSEEVVTVLPRYLVWSGLAASVWNLSRRYPLAGRGAAANVAVHAAGMGLFVLVQTVAFTLSDVLYSGARAVPRPAVFLLGGLSYAPYDLVLYVGVLGVYHAITYHQAFVARSVKDAQLETRMAQAELDSLRTHLQPAFLFESLDAVAALMSANVRGARKGLADLSELLRLSLNEGGGRPVALAEEVELLERYFAVRALARRGDSRLRLSVPPAEGAGLVAPALLQPIADALLECAAERAATAVVEVRANLDGDLLRLDISASGATPGELGRERIAAAAVRLERLYGTQASLEWTAGTDESRVRLTLPFATRDGNP